MRGQPQSVESPSREVPSCHACGKPCDGTAYTLLCRLHPVEVDFPTCGRYGCIAFTSLCLGAHLLVVHSDPRKLNWRARLVARYLPRALQFGRRWFPGPPKPRRPRHSPSSSTLN